MKKYFSYTLCLTLILLTSNYSHAEMASGASADMALMAEMKNIPIATYLKHLERMQKKDTLTKVEKENKVLAVFASEVLDAKNISSHSDSPAMITTPSIVQAIYSQMTSSPLWDKPLTAAKIKKITASKETLLKAFGPKSYQWAWVLNALGEKENAKKILLENFEAQYANTMKLTETYGDPLTEIEINLQALSTLCDKEKNIELNSKLKEMKMHIGKLPNAMIMT